MDATEAAGLAGHRGTRLAVFEDFDHNRTVDLLLVTAEGSLRLYRGVVGGAFFDETELLGLGSFCGAIDAAWTDFDRDGRLDLRLETESGGPALFHCAGAEGFERVELGLPVADLTAGMLVVGSPRTQAEITGDTSTDPASVRPSGDSSAPILPTSGVTIQPAPDMPPTGTAFQCMDRIEDASMTSNCLQASSVPTLDYLYPLSEDLFVAPSGDVGIGLLNPASKLDVRGQILASGAFGGGFRAFYAQGSVGGVTKIGATSGGEDRGPLAIQTGDTDRIYLDADDGQVGIGRSHGELANGEIVASFVVNFDPADNLPAVRVEKASSTAIGNYSGLAFKIANQLGHLGDFETTQIVDVLEAANNAHGLAFWTRTTAQSWGERMRIASNGNIGIGTTAPSFLLHVNGNAGKPGGGPWSVASDARLKKDIQPLGGALERILAVHGVSFEYVDPAAISELPGRQMGVIAQEVERVFPQWVDEGMDGYMRVTFRGFEALTVEALRELREEKDAEIAELRAEKDAEISNLAARLAKLEQIAVSFGMDR